MLISVVKIISITEKVHAWRKKCSNNVVPILNSDVTYTILPNTKPHT